ncbi:unnamed protein product [Acanthosepion pharaonis]|uniref:Helitron helicase-like domain-containing protein n=1 Tax=Acanthosepion pharaonis TaxID=158019 RepID=A0A812CFT2_ACAPH|nr:unnamed protein product [Sepia pharaonis]
MRLSQVAQGSALTQALQSQEEDATCLARKAAERTSLRSRFKNEQRLSMNAQAAVTASASRASEIHHQRLLPNVRNAAATAKSRAIETLNRKPSRQSRDAAATSIRAAETLLRRSVRNATNAATTARSRTAETFDRRLARQSRDAAATARSRESETELQRATRNAVATSAARNSEGPHTRANRLSRAATNMAAVHLSQIPQARRIRLDGDIQRLAAARIITCPSSSFWSFLAFNYDPGINLTTRDDINWAGKPTSLCCSSGKVRLPLLHEPPTPLRGLIDGSHPDSNHFLKIIRQYNSSQMTSFGAQVVREEGWMPNFKVQGQLYHRIRSLLPEETSTPKFLQMYFIADYNLQAETRIGNLPPSGRVPRRDVILLLQAMFHEVNSYIHSFKYALENAPFPSFSIVNDVDKRPHDGHGLCYNAPACNEVAATIHGEQDLTRDIVLKSRGVALRRISEIHRSYDALQYPLLFHYDDGYHFGIHLHIQGGQSTTSPRALSCKAFYSYRFMVRDGDFNLLHRCRELFHQFAVDMAAKMELERLCFIWNHQKQLCSDSYVHLRDSLRN